MSAGTHHVYRYRKSRRIRTVSRNISGVNTFWVREIIVSACVCITLSVDSCSLTILKPGQLRHNLKKKASSHIPPLVPDNPEAFATSSISKLSRRQCEPSWRKRRTASWLSRMYHAGSSKIMVCRLLASLLFSNDKDRR